MGLVWPLRTVHVAGPELLILTTAVLLLLMTWRKRAATCAHLELTCVSYL